MTVQPLSIPEVKLIHLPVHRDARGSLMEVYKRSSFLAAGIAETFVQWNRSRSRRGVIRGLHCQIPPKAHAKLVCCAVGEILDVAVDVRRGSPSYGRHVAVRLSAESGAQLYIPAGFAHGFAVLSELAEVNYGLSSEFDPEHEVGIAWDDPELAIDWGIEAPILSARDRANPPLRAIDTRFVYGGGGCGCW